MKPDDHLTNDSPIAPADAFESPYEEHIVKTNPLAGNEEDYSVFNEAPTPGTTYDIDEAHDPADPEGHVPRALAQSHPLIAERFKPVPLWVIAGCGALLLWAGLYLGSYSGGFQGDVFNEEANYKPVGPTGPVDPIAVSKKRGHGIFIQNCAQCHQQDGNGVAGQFPPLTASEWVIGDAPKRLPFILLHGIQGTIHVKGAVYNNAMPAWGATLSDKDIANVLTYVRGELGGNSAPPITEQNIADARKAPPHDDPYTEAELLSIPPGPLDGGAPPAPAGAAPGAPSAPNGANPPNTTGADKPAAAPLGQGPAATPAAKP